MPSPFKFPNRLAKVDLGSSLVKPDSVDSTHLDRCIEAFSAAGTNTSWQELSQFRALTNSTSSPSKGPSHADRCNPYAQHPALGNGLGAPSAEPPWLLQSNAGERSTTFDELLAIVGIQLNGHLEQLRAAYLEDLRLASCVTTAAGLSEPLATRSVPMPANTKEVPTDTSAALLREQALTEAEDSPQSAPATDDGKAMQKAPSSGQGKSTTPSGHSRKSLLHPRLFAAPGFMPSADAEGLELEAKAQRMFEEMDEDGSGSVSASEFLTLLRSYGISDVTMEEIEQTFLSFTRCTLGEESVALTLESFRDLLSNMTLDLDEMLGETTANKVRQLRASISKCDMSKMILKAAGVQEESRFHHHSEERNTLVLIEALVVFIIVLNALAMGVAADVPWDGWPFVDACFALFFVFEVAIKLWLYGPRKYLCGPAMLWNCGDIVVAILAMVDFVIFNLLKFGDSGSLRNLTLIRLMRLIRLARLVKLLRLKVFKELKLIVRGVFFGLRTLGWALILFVFFLYGIALMIRLIMVPAEGAMPSESPYCNPDDTYCERSQQMIDTHYDELFSDTPRCIITLLRCFTDGCASVDGTPLIPTLFNIYGYPLLISYIMFMFFITFGLFNLITAILVENTVEAAKNDRARGMSLRQAEQLRIATKLKVFIDRTRRLMAEVRRSGSRHLSSSKSSLATDRKLSYWSSVSSWLGFGGKRQPVLEDLMDDMTEVNITADMFFDLIWDPEISEVLDDLEISAGNREGLFDVLDADGSGSLTAEELITGLLKLRGSAEKSDVVGVMLGVRSLQRELKGQLKPMIRVLGALEQDTSNRMCRVEQVVASLVPAAKNPDVSSSD